VKTYFTLVQGGLIFESRSVLSVHEQRKKQSNAEMKQKTQVLETELADRVFCFSSRRIGF
jgi:hypothetical protein